MLAVLILLYFVTALGAIAVPSRNLASGWWRVAVSLAIVALPPVGISVLMFPPGSGAGIGLVILLPLLWIVGFAAVTSGNLIDRR